MCRVVVVVALLGLLALAGARQASNGPDSDVELESRKYSKTHKKTGADKHTKNKYSDNHKPDTKHQVPKYPSPPAYAPDHPPPGSDKAYPAPGDSYKWWREHDADNQHKYKKGGGDKEYKEPWGEYAPPRDGYGPRDDYGYSGLNDEGYYSRSKGCSGLPPACDRFAVYTANEAGQGDYPPGFGPSEKTRKCASTGAAYAWPASCKGYNSIGSTCTGAAFCQEAGVPGSATATCTRSGWTVSNKCGVCEGAPPAWPRNTWPSTCQDIAVGSTCNGDCESSFEGTPVASCPSKRQGWVVTGECQLARCIGPLPDVANATWATYCPGQTVGAVCEATCDSPSEEVGTINATCTPDAEWVAGGDGFCGTRLSQVSLIFFADSINNCTQEAVDAIKNSVNQELEDSNVQVIIVEVLCFNPDGDVGAISNRTMSVAKQEATNRLRFDVFAQYIGGTEAGEQLVQTAITSPNEIGDLVDNLEAAGATLDPDATSGSVTGGDIIDPVQQEPRLTLTRIGSGPLQTNTQFSLTASYTVGGVPQAGVQITGPTIDPATSVTCTPIGSTTTSAAGTVSWQCVTGNTPGSVNITVAAVDTVSAPLSLTIGTDCVGAFGEFGACSSVCADVPGEKVQFFTVTTPAANGGRPCQFADGANITEPCTGELCCKGSPALEAANVLYTQDFSTNADGWIELNPPDSGDMVQESGFIPAFGSSSGVGQVVMSGQCICPDPNSNSCLDPCPGPSCGTAPASCRGPFTRFGQTVDEKFWRNLTQDAPNGFVTQLAMYLDTSEDNQLLDDTRVDYSVALNLNDIDNTFVQDFVFNLGFYNESNPKSPGSNERRFIVSGTNNAYRPQPTISPVAISQSGWYIFQHLFYPEGDNLSANLTIYNGVACGEAVGTWPKVAGSNSNPPPTLEQFGYVRYGWIVLNEYPAAANLTVAGQVLATLGA